MRYARSMLLVKVLLLALLGFIVVSLFAGLFFLVKDKGQTNRTANALTVRIGLSIAAIVVVLIAGLTGVLEMNPQPGSAAERAATAARDAPDDAQGGGGGGRTRIPLDE